MNSGFSKATISKAVKHAKQFAKAAVRKGYADANPFFPELRWYLEAVFFDGQGSEYVVTRYRGTNANLRTQFLRILDKAGIPAWPRLFHNMCASRETELAVT